MGKPTSATVVYNDGRLQPFGDVDAALTQVDRGRVEFQYAYGPDMLPPYPARGSRCGAPRCTRTSGR